MKFDWSEYLTLANNLAESKWEASIRAAISRAYYAAFGVANEFLRSEGWMPSDDGNSHAQVWRAFLVDDRERRKVAIAGDRIKRYRRAADYDANCDELADWCDETREAAEEIIDRVRTLSS